MDPRTTRPRGFTWEQRELLWKLHREGVPRRSIAKRLGKAPGSVHDVIRNTGGIAPRLRTRHPASRSRIAS
jgi:IS30 family transposase